LIRFVHAPLISLAAGHRYTDTTNGFRAYSAKLLSDPRVAPLRGVFVNYNLHYYLTVRSSRLGLAVGEIPVIRKYPAYGKTPTKITMVRGNLGVLKELFMACFRLYDPPRKVGK
jgi:hypothetical protein